METGEIILEREERYIKLFSIDTLQAEHCTKRVQESGISRNLGNHIESASDLPSSMLINHSFYPQIDDFPIAYGVGDGVRYIN